MLVAAVMAAAAMPGSAVATPAISPALTTKSSTSTAATVEFWIDGDTVVTSKGTIRLIGIDTPERGTCGVKKARRWARAHAPVGSTVRLINPPSVINKDKYDRKLRFVVAQGLDIGLGQIRHGAKARYDGRDGYDHHPRQKSYRKADAKHADYRC